MTKIGYDPTAAGTDAYAIAVGTLTGHVFDVHYDSATGSATWTTISYDIGDQPITNVQLDKATGDIYAGTDLGVLRLANGTTSWVKAGEGLPAVAVYHLLLAPGEKAGRRVLYAATHGRGVWRIKLGGGGTTRSDAMRAGPPLGGGPSRRFKRSQ